jgi:hypothetical protein
MKTIASMSHSGVNRRLPMTFRKLRLFGTLTTPIVGAAFLAGIGPANATVTEPDGLQVPNLAANTGPNGNGETDLGTFFKNLGETFDVMAAASAQPATFSPMCDFSAQLWPSRARRDRSNLLLGAQPK